MPRQDKMQCLTNFIHQTFREQLLLLSKLNTSLIELSLRGNLLIEGGSEQYGRLGVKNA